jgi:hypothetical protein
LVRIYVVHGSNRVSEFLSAGTLYGGLCWSRSGTTLTVTSTSHGLTTGDYVILRGFNVDYVHVSITSTGTDTFTCTVADSGAASGDAGAYVPVLEASTFNDTAITIDAPSAGNVQLVSCVVYIAGSETSPKTLTVPSNALTNGAGKNASANSRVIPSYRAYNMNSGATIGDAGLTFNTSGTFNVYSLAGSIDTFGDVSLVLQF